MGKSQTSILVLAGLLLGTGVLYSNCGKNTRLTADAEKQKFLSKNSVFAAAVSDGGSGFTWEGAEQFDGGSAFGQNQGENGGSGGGSGPGTPGSGGGGTNFDAELGYKNDPNDLANIGITVPPPGTPSGMGSEIDAPGMSEFGIPRIRVCLQADNNESGFQFLREDNVTYSTCGPCVVIDRVNGRCLRVTDAPPPLPSGDPLIIDMIGDNRSLEGLENLQLTSPELGVDFDLFGGRALPTAHSKAKISWTNNATYMYLVLPNSNGQVLGINDMFGDSTLGPDRRYSLDGFQALTKYDGRDAQGIRVLRPADGMIDGDDAVFNRLRLWADTNGNGAAEASELKTLSEKGIVSIDLKYDPNFYERDIYGNEAIFKSVVEFDDGHKGMIFDLWFKPLSSQGAATTSGLRAPASQ